MTFRLVRECLHLLYSIYTFKLDSMQNKKNCIVVVHWHDSDGTLHINPLTLCPHGCPPNECKLFNSLTKTIIQLVSKVEFELVQPDSESEVSKK